MLNLMERMQRLTAAEIVATYVAKFLLGVGVGLLLAGRRGWPYLLAAVLIGMRAEMKFWRKQ